MKRATVLIVIAAAAVSASPARASTAQIDRGRAQHAAGVAVAREARFLWRQYERSLTVSWRVRSCSYSDVAASCPFSIRARNGRGDVVLLCRGQARVSRHYRTELEYGCVA
jgi:hypothetical protein